ncbi:LacI family transcriptional regulator [Paenibacillus hemerocallicola]|uniref:LacI family transcriptional regulator n=1 Tax=Paenibacillus hemerocallicola TaxID=1172614 RepID=A0A5C4SXI1_9BACL|nr:LacI family DNA-binding transcriptional regulator [Paenibacillus hemerocallicola]TNJ54739.1 LacI family transcriptional regulator [Paenibacillus hemerocallicola]
MVTIKDIAKAAGVNHSTVSRALNDDYRVSDNTKERIQAIAKQMNYIPNLAAKQLVQQKTHVVGLIWPPKEGLFFYNMSVQLQMEGAQRGYRVVLIADFPGEGMAAFRQLGVDHIMLWNCYPNLPVSFYTERARFRGEVLAMAGPRVDGAHLLGVDRQGAFVQAVRHLHALGHRRLSYIGRPTHRDKLSGFIQGHAEQNLKYDPAFVVSDISPTFEEEVLAMLKRSDRPTAMLVSSQTVLFRLLRIFRRSGIQIPDDLSVVVYDDVPELEELEVAFTAIGPSAQEMAVRAWDILTGTYGEGEERYVDEVMPARLVQRESTRSL